MDENHYRALLDEVRKDIADAEKTLAQLSNLEEYLLGKIEGQGANPASGSNPAQSTRSSKKGAGSREQQGPSVEGMQTVEFGPDGFPSS